MSLKRPNGRQWFYVIAFIAFDVVLLWAAKEYFRKAPTEAELSTEMAEDYFALPGAQETRALADLERAAGSGSWESVEGSRQRMVEAFQRSRERPSRGTALYFFPELLPETSLESAFARNELAPGLAALRAAHEKGENAARTEAYGLLKTRVENYEAGASVDPGEDGFGVSAEARQFLRMYGRLTGMKYPYPNAPPDGQ